MLDTIGNRIKEAIKNSDYTQSAIADECGVSKQAVTGWTNKNSIDKTNLLIVGKLTKYNYEWLLTGKGEKLTINYKTDSINHNTEIKEQTYSDLTRKEMQLINLYRQISKSEKENMLQLNSVFSQLNNQQQTHIIKSCVLYITPESPADKKTA